LPVSAGAGSARGSVLQGVFLVRPFSFAAVNPGAMRGQAEALQAQHAELMQVLKERE
jgi:hypothetical protein